MGSCCHLLKSACSPKECSVGENNAHAEPSANAYVEPQEYVGEGSIRLGFKMAVLTATPGESAVCFGRHLL